MNRKRRVLRYLRETGNWALTYHNYRELSAWAIIVFYVLFLGLVAMGRSAIHASGGGAKLLGVVVVVLITAAAFVLLWQQLRLRSWAGSLSAACRSLAITIENRSSKQLGDSPVPLEVHPCDQRRGAHQLPRVLLDELDRMRQHDRTDYWLFEISVYAVFGLLFIWTIISLLQGDGSNVIPDLPPPWQAV